MSVTMIDIGKIIADSIGKPIDEITEQDIVLYRERLRKDRRKPIIEVREYTAEELCNTETIPNARYFRIKISGNRQCKGCKLLNGRIIYYFDISILNENQHEGCNWKFIPVLPDDPNILEDDTWYNQYIPKEPVLEIVEMRNCLEQSSWWKKREKEREREFSEDYFGVVLKKEKYEKGEYNKRSGYFFYHSVCRTLEKVARPLTVNDEWIIDVLRLCFNNGMNNYQSSRAYRLLGELYLEIGDKKNALDAYRNALEKDSKVGVKKAYERLKKEIESIGGESL